MKKTEKLPESVHKLKSHYNLGTPLDATYSKTGPETEVKSLSVLVNSPRPSPKKRTFANEKPLIYGSVNQPLLKLKPDILENLDEYQMDKWKVKLSASLHGRNESTKSRINLPRVQS